MIQTEQLDLQKASKQEKADYSNAMHNSKCRPNNDMEIRCWRFSWRFCEECFPPCQCCSLQHYAKQTQAGCKSLLRKHKELNLEKKNSCWEQSSWHCQKEKKTWLKCMSVADKPEFNCHGFEIWTRNYDSRFIQHIGLAKDHSFRALPAHWDFDWTIRLASV